MWHSKLHCVLCNTHYPRSRYSLYLSFFATFLLKVSTFGKNSGAKFYPFEPIEVLWRVNLNLVEFPLSDWNYKYCYCDYITSWDLRKRSASSISDWQTSIATHFIIRKTLIKCCIQCEYNFTVLWKQVFKIFHMPLITLSIFTTRKLK